MISKKLVEVRTYHGSGFKPLIFFNSWRVGVLNYAETLEPGHIHSVERHMETDEVFVLVQGEGILFAGKGEPEVEKLYAQAMELGVLYNVKAHAWHTLVLGQEASVLIMENADTGARNSQHCELRPEQRRYIMDIALREKTTSEG